MQKRSRSRTYVQYLLVGKFIAGATFGEGAAPPTKLSLALTEMLNVINEYTAQGSQGNFETFLERVALCKDTK